MCDNASFYLRMFKLAGTFSLIGARHKRPFLTDVALFVADVVGVAVVWACLRPSCRFYHRAPSDMAPGEIPLGSGMPHSVCRCARILLTNHARDGHITCA
jgi:hypothetical protein